MANVLRMYTILLLVYHEGARLVNNCKTSQIGDDYKGTLSKSHAGYNCEYWSMASNELKINLRDFSFPDGSKQLAKNYCRNPTREPSGPWCYVRNKNLQSDSCHVPFCSKEDCRLTGTGEEYRGEQKKSISGNDCRPWEDRERFQYFNDSYFCSAKQPTECNLCRNPDASKAGPWCATTTDNGFIEELCNVPFCDDGPVRLFTGGNGDLATFHKLINSTALSIRIRLWNPLDWYDGRISIVLSALNIPLGMQDFSQWGSALSLTIGNTGSAFMGSEIYDRTDTPGILSGSQWTNVKLTWEQNALNSLQLYVFFNEDRKPRLMASLNTTFTVLENFEFSYFAVVGTLAFFQFSPGIDDCLITSTSLNNYTMWQQLPREAEQVEIVLHYRLFHDGSVHFKEFPQQDDIVKVHLCQNGSIIIEDLDVGEVFEYLMDTPDFWKWNSINISMNGSSIFVSRYNLEEEIMTNETIIHSIYKLAWVAMSSNSVGYWALNCESTDLPDVSKPEPPECASSKSELEYNGSQSVSETGKHCVPWIDKRVREVYHSDKDFKNFGGRVLSNNFCRNLDSDENGPFCFVKHLNIKNKQTVIKEKCAIRHCTMLDCKHSGIGTDYIGDLLITKSFKKCSSNYCRNPDNSLGGPWCNINNTNVPKDYCNVRDCERSDSPTILMSDENSYFYILPPWRKSGIRFWLKNWVPELNAQVLIKLLDDSKNHLKIIINEEGNDKVTLRLISNVSDELLLEETMPHLIRTAGWTGLWLRCGLGFVELGHEKIEIPFLSWESGPTELNWKIYPTFLSFRVQSGSWLGVNFNVKECLIARVTTNSLSYWPVIFNNSQNKTLLKLYLQGYGTVKINFYISPESSEYYSLIIEDGRKLYWGFFQETMKLLTATELLDDLIRNNTWTEIILRFNETFCVLESNNRAVLVHSVGENESPLLLYWFNVHATSGEFSWAANCQPLELSGEPRDGRWSEWGPWDCSDSCGGSLGRRERECNNPPPNILGMECTGPAVHEGNCNEFPCGDIPPGLQHQIRNELGSKSIQWNFEVGSRTILDCSRKLSQLLIQSIPTVEFIWTKNGISYYAENSKTNRDTLELWNLSINNSGIWTCSAFWQFSGANKTTVMKIIVLNVRSESASITVRETLPLTLPSNVLALSHVYADLSLQWLLNEALWHDYGVIPINLVIFEKIQAADKSHTGVWVCVVSQEDLGLKWTTAYYNVNVIDPPNFWSYLQEDNATEAIFGTMTQDTVKTTLLCGLAIFFVIVLACAVAICKL